MAPGTSSGHILVVDDSHPNQELLHELLQPIGYTLERAYDGLAALENLGGATFDVVLLDVQMPKLDGFGVLARIREEHDQLDLPVIMITSCDDSKDIVRALELGANDYITKPIDLAVCSARVRTQVALRRTTRRLKDATTELAQQNRILQELNKEKNQFVGMAAHDLRNPLAVIKGYADYLCMAGERISADKIRRFMEEIRSSSQFMLSLVNDLLSVARIEAGHLQLERVPTNLCDLLRNSVQLNGTVAARKQIEIRFTGVEQPVTLLADPHKLEQTFNNLLSNAIKFSHPGSPIDVHLERIDREVRIRVQDRGQGIPPREIDRLFRPFERTSVKSTAGEESTGLGLVIVRRIVEGHGGRIWVESAVGHGSTFHVSLPDSKVE